MKIFPALLFLIAQYLDGQIIWDKEVTGGGIINRSICPQPYQLYPRNSADRAVVRLAGTTATGNAVHIDVTARAIDGKNTIAYRQTHSLTNQHFDVSVTISAGLFEYDFYCTVLPGGRRELIAENVVCGDVFLLSGQSNIETWDLSTGETDYLNVRFGPGTKTRFPEQQYYRYARGFGHPTPLPDRLTWARAGVNGYPHRHVGAPALVMMNALISKFRIPIAVISGAVGATDITTHHLPEPGEYFFNAATYTVPPQGIDPKGADIYRLFAALNTNVHAAGVENHVRGFFWMQGDGGVFNTETGYVEEFRRMQLLWHHYFPGSWPTIVIQVHAWVEHEAAMRRISEEQRRLAFELPRTVVMSANGIGHHRTESGHEIHFRAQGYENLGQRMAGVAGYHVYHHENRSVLSPDVSGAARNGHEIIIYFTQPLSSEKSDPLPNVLHAIKFDAGSVEKLSPEIDGHRLRFTVTDTSMTKVSYAGFVPDTSSGNSGKPNPDFPCYLKNGNGVAALSFHDIPIAKFDPESLLETPDDEVKPAIEQTAVFPNPCVNTLNITSQSPIQSVIIHDFTGLNHGRLDGQSLHEISLDVSYLVDGFYQIAIETKSAVKRFIFIKQSP